jgi:hypothetical protein
VAFLSQIYPMLACDFLDTWPALINPFEALHHTMCYLYHHQHLPIIYPAKPTTPTGDGLQAFWSKGHAEYLSSDCGDDLAIFADADHAKCLQTRHSISEYLYYTMVFWSLGPARNNPSLLYIPLPVRLQHCTRVPLKLSFYIPFYSPLGFHYLQHLQLMKTIQEPLN